MVGNEQSAHFKQLKAVLKEMGYDWSDDMTHVAFGLVTKNGKKLSTRKGNVILLEPTIAEAVNRAQAQIEAKNPNLPNKELLPTLLVSELSSSTTLKQDRMNGYDFDLDAMVSFEGKLDLRYSMHTLVSNLSCARLTSRHLQMLHTA